MKLERECHAFDFYLTKKEEIFFTYKSSYVCGCNHKLITVQNTNSSISINISVTFLYRMDLDIDHKNTLINIQHKNQFNKKKTNYFCLLLTSIINV